LLLAARLANRNDPIDIAAHRVGAGEQATGDQAKRVDPGLGVGPPVIQEFANTIFEHDGAKSERDTMFGAVGGVFRVIELDIHAALYGLAVCGAMEMSDQGFMLARRMALR
jgi:hypothetical protein